MSEVLSLKNDQQLERQKKELETQQENLTAKTKQIDIDMNKLQQELTYAQDPDENVRYAELEEHRRLETRLKSIKTKADQISYE